MADVDVTELRRRANSEPNPRLRKQYTQALAKADGVDYQTAVKNLSDVRSGLESAGNLARDLVGQLRSARTRPGAIISLGNAIAAIGRAESFVDDARKSFPDNPGKAARPGDLRKFNVNWQDDDSARVPVGSKTIVTSVGLTSKGSARAYVAIDGETTKYRFSKTGMSDLDAAKAWAEKTVSALSDVCVAMDAIEESLKQIEATIE